MRIYLMILLLTMALEEVTCGVFWNRKPQIMRIRTRPPRHYNPTSYQHPHNRMYKPMQMRLVKPTFYSPMKSNRPQYGQLVVNAPHPNIQRVTPNNFMHGVGVQHHYPIESYPRPQPPEFSKFKNPISNLVDSPGVKVESDINQHGYLSPTYSGWKPISKPYYGLKGPLSGQEMKSYHMTPTTEHYATSSTIRNQNFNIDTIFQENIKQIEPLNNIKLKPEFSENRGVTLPVPPQTRDNTFRIPAVFFERPVQTVYESFNTASSQSEEKPVIYKPFPKFSSRPKPGVPNDSNSGSEVSTDSPQLLSKFKISRPKLKVQSHASFQHNEPEIEGLGQGAPPKVTLSANNENGGTIPIQSYQHHHHQQIPNVNKLRPRVKVRERKPEGFVSTDQLSHVLSYRPLGQTPGSVKEPIGSSDSRQPPPPRAQSHTHPSPTYLGNETYDVIPFRRLSFPMDFPISGFHSDFMNGFGSDEQEQRPIPRPPITVPAQKIPEGVSIGFGGSKQNVVQSPFQPSGDGDRIVRRKKAKQSQHKTTTTTTAPILYNQSPGYPEEFYMPHGFSQSPSLGGQNPVSFMTMPNAQPQVIHHTLQQPTGHKTQTTHQHLYPINFGRSPEPYSNYNGEEHGAHGTSPNNIFQQNNNPNKPGFVFMNIQNGDIQASSPSGQGNLGSQHFDIKDSPKSFYSHGFKNQQEQQGGTSLELNPPYHQFSPMDRGTTPRSLYRFPIPSPPLQSYDYMNQVHVQGQNNYAHPSVKLETYASNEYERIPLEFLNDLRPILLDEPLPTLSSIPTSSSRALLPENSFESSKHSFTASRLQGNSFDGFPRNPFQKSEQNSFESSRGQKHPLDSSEKNSGSLGFTRELFQVPPYGGSEESTHLYFVTNHPHQEQSTERTGGEWHDNYKSAASNFQPQVIKQEIDSTTSTFHKSSLRPPMISISPLQEFTLVTTISPIQDMSLYRSPQPTTKWSKLKVGEQRISSTESYNAMTNKYKKLVNKEVETESQLGQEIKQSSSTPRPSSLKNGPEDDPERSLEGSYSHPTPLVLKNMTSDSSEDDSSDSNTPKSARVRATSQNGIQSITQTTQKPTTTDSTTSNRRLLRRRRPGMLSKRNFGGNGEVSDGVGVTTHRPRRIITSSGSTTMETEDGAMGFESSRLKTKSHRGRGETPLMVRIGLSSEDENEKKVSTTPESVDLYPVTYGESQWFKIKENSGKNEEYYHTIQKGSKDVLNEKKEGRKISFSSRILSTTPHVKLEPLGSDDRVKESRNLSTKKFYSTGTVGEGESRQKDQVTATKSN